MLHAWIDPAACHNLPPHAAALTATVHDVDAVVMRARALSPRDQFRLAIELVEYGLPQRSVYWAGDPAVLPELPRWCAGAHLPSSMIGRIDEVRALGYPTVGCSVHNLDELRRASGADFVTISPVFAPRSKPFTGTALGLDGLLALRQQTSLPVIALGGVTADHVAAIAQTGVAGVAALSPFCSEDLTEAGALIAAVAAARWSGGPV